VLHAGAPCAPRGRLHGAMSMSAERCRKIAGGARIRGGERLRTKYNLTPRSYVPVVRSCALDTDKDVERTPDSVGGRTVAREVCSMRWGLVPSFAKRAEDYDAFSGGSSTFNARVESLQSSGLWRRLLDSRRGVMLFDGFYEWRKAGKAKVPMFIRNSDDYDGHVIGNAAPDWAPEADKPSADVDTGPRHAPLMLAALYDIWKGPKEGKEGDEKSDAKVSAAFTFSEPLESATILTMGSEGTPMFQVHDRMPVFLTPETAALWLNPAKQFSDIIQTVLKTSMEHAQELYMYEVAPLVSNVKNESPDCILPKKEWDNKSLSGGLGRFFKKVDPASPNKVAAPNNSLKPASDSLKAPTSEVKGLGTGSKRLACPSPGAEKRPTKVVRIQIDIDD